MPGRIVNQAGATTKRAAAATTKFGKDISNKYFKKDKKEDGEKTEEAKVAATQKPTVDLPEETYIPAPVRPTVFIPNQPTSPGAPSAPVPEAPAPSVPAAPPLPNDVKLPDLQPVDLPE